MRISTILYSAAIVFAMAACFEDKGNYDYHAVDIAEIDTTGFQLTYTIGQFNDLVIDPRIQYEGDAANLSFEWLMYVKSYSSSAPASTVIATTEILDRTMAEAPDDYVLELVVTDEDTGIKTNMTFTLTIEASVETGWLVLHTDGTQSDVDFIVTMNAVPTASSEKWLQNVYATANGAPVQGAGKFVTQVLNTSVYVNYINIGTDEALVRASGDDLFKVNDQTDIFIREGIQVTPQACEHHGYFESLIADGNLYMVNYALSAVLSTGTIGYYAPVAYDYELAPYIPDLSSSANNYATSYYQAIALYDVENHFFVQVPYTFASFTVNSFVPQTSGPFDVNDIGKELLYMERAYQDYTYAFFKDLDGDGRWLYVADFYNYDAGTVAQAAYEMTDLPAIDEAKFYQCGDLGYVLYYATDQAIYLFDYYGAGTASIAFDGFSGDEEITSMKIYKPKTYNNLTDVNNRILYVATWSESAQAAKLYELAINPTSGAITQTPLNVFEGFDGKIVDMCRKVKG